MLFIYLMFMMMILSITSIFMKHPLSIGFNLLIQTFMTCLITGLMFYSFWFSYILFLIFLGGMLVLFIYMTSLASNEMFMMSMKMLLWLMSLMMILIFMALIIDKQFLLQINNNEMEKFYTILNFIEENYMISNKLYNYPSNFMTLILINYLFFTLIVSVKITNFIHGPLRLMI